MKYRAGMIGARFEISLNEPRGTVVRVMGEKAPMGRTRSRPHQLRRKYDSCQQYMGPFSGCPVGNRPWQTQGARVLIVDDHPIVRQGLRRVMENEEDLSSARGGNRPRCAHRHQGAQSDVVIADLSLKQGDGIELVRDVRAHHPNLPILVLSMHDETIYAERMLSRAPTATS